MARVSIGKNQQAALHTLKLHVKTGDIVMVIAGGDKKTTGRVMSVNREAGKVVVEGVNIHKRFKKGAQKGQGEIQEVALPIDASNVMLVCPSCNKPTRTRSAKDGERRTRQCKKCEALIPTPFVKE